MLKPLYIFEQEVSVIPVIPGYKRLAILYAESEEEDGGSYHLINENTRSYHPIKSSSLHHHGLEIRLEEHGMVTVQNGTFVGSTRKLEHGHVLLVEGAFIHVRYMTDILSPPRSDKAYQ